MAESKHIIRRIIELGYDLPSFRGGVMWFRVGASPSNPVDWEELLSAIASIDSYNEFDGRDAATMIAWAADNVGIVLVEFGREYSPVLYLHPAGGTPLYKGSKADIARFLKTAREMFRIIPDEATWDKSRGCLRIWWD